MLPDHEKLVCTYGSLWFPGGRVSLDTWKDVSAHPSCLSAPPGAMLSACVGLLLVSFIPSLTVFSPFQHVFSHQLPSFHLHPDLPPCNTQASIIPEDIIASNAFFLSLLNYKLYRDRGWESDVLLNFCYTHRSAGVPWTSEE